MSGKTKEMKEWEFSNSRGNYWNSPERVFDEMEGNLRQGKGFFEMSWKIHGRVLDKTKEGKQGKRKFL